MLSKNKAKEYFENVNNLLPCRIGSIYEDVTTDVLGEIGTWQWLVTLVSTIIMMPSLFSHYEDVHLLHPSEIMCVPTEGHEIKHQSLCSYTLINGTEEIQCNIWHVKLLWLIWVKKTWLVFCNDNTRQLATTMICRLGLIFGFVIYGLAADSIGRRIAIMCDVLVTFILSLVIVFCDSSAWFRLVLFLKCLFGSCTIYMGLVIICEIASNKWRTWLNIIVMAPRLFSLVSVVPLANSAPNIETYSFIGCIFGILNIIVLKWIPESPQWLLYNRKINTAEKLLHNAALQNSIKFSGDFKIRPVNYRAYNCLDETTTCIGFLAAHNVRVMVLLTLLFWFLYYFLWENLYLIIYKDGYINNTLLLEFVCLLSMMVYVTLFPCKQLTMKKWLVVNVLLTGTFTGCITIFNHELLYYVPSSIALAAGVAVHALMLNMTPRFYATNVRATLFGFCHATGQLGAIISYTFHIYEPVDSFTTAAVEIIVTMSLVGLCYVFPDVDDRELPDVLEDMDYFAELSKPLRWATQKRNSPSYEEVELRDYSFSSARAGNGSEERGPAKPISCISFSVMWEILLYYIRIGCTSSVAAWHILLDYVQRFRQFLENYVRNRRERYYEASNHQ